MGEGRRICLAATAEGRRIYLEVPRLPPNLRGSSTVVAVPKSMWRPWSSAPQWPLLDLRGSL
jgi:hypothetical protein